MANTAKTIEAGPTHADTLYIGGASETVLLRGALKKTVGTVAADGSNQTDATAISAQVTYVTAANGTKGVKLPTAAAGLEYVVYNLETSLLKLYPATDDDINDGSTNASISIPPKSVAACVAVDAVTWAVSYDTALVKQSFTLEEAVNIAVDTSTGTKIGTGATQKLGFFNATAIVQPAHANQAAVSAATATERTTGTLVGTANGAFETIADTSSGDRKAEISNNFKELQTVCNALIVDAADARTKYNQVRSDLVNLGLIKGSA